MRTPESESLLGAGLVTRSTCLPAGRLASRKGDSSNAIYEVSGTANTFSDVLSMNSMEGWAVAQSPILVTTVTLDILQQRGYESMLNYYLKVAPQLNEPPPDRTGRAVYVTRMYSGVSGAPHRLQAVRPPSRL